MVAQSRPRQAARGCEGLWGWFGTFRMVPMVSPSDLTSLLEPFGVQLDSQQQGQVLTYLELLLRWNQKINLTGVRRPEECVTRHFGESLMVSRHVELSGRLLDIGSGAGFPGLALKIVSPDLRVTLLEPSAKKRAFLKEVARSCEWESVEVRPERLEEFVQLARRLGFDLATARAVGSLGRLVSGAARSLRDGGRLCLWVGASQAGALAAGSKLAWDDPIAVPLSRSRQLWIGTFHVEHSPGDGT